MMQIIKHLMYGNEIIFAESIVSKDFFLMRNFVSYPVLIFHVIIGLFNFPDKEQGIKTFL